MLTEKALHPFSKLILCIQLCHAALDHMVAKCTNPSDSFIICGLRIMCLMLPNNDFFFLILVTCSHSIFFIFWLRCINTLVSSPQSGFIFSNFYLIIFRHQMKSTFVFRKQRTHAGPCHDVPPQWQPGTTLDFVHSEIPFNLSHLLLGAILLSDVRMMIDSSLISLKEWFPAGAAGSFVVRAEEEGLGGLGQGAVLIVSWCHHLSVSWAHSRAVSTFLQSASGNWRARCISPSALLRSSLIFSSIPRESPCLFIFYLVFVLQLSQFLLFFHFLHFYP